MIKVLRSNDYRYTVECENAELTPLASIKSYVGTLEVRLYNISQGGMAIIFDREPQMEIGDVIEVSVAIRERPFPVQAEVKAKRGLRLSCAFINPPRAFSAALREFLKPKFLGQTLELNAAFSGRSDVLELVPHAAAYEVFLGQNQTGVFVWTGPNRSLLKLVAVGQEIILEWTYESGLRTGRLKALSQPSATSESVDSDGIQWHRVSENSIVHYFTDVLLAWLPNNIDFVEALLKDQPETQLIFPDFKSAKL